MNNYIRLQNSRYGKWFNGKTLYRRMISSTAPKVTTDNTFVAKSHYWADKTVEDSIIEFAYLENSQNQRQPLPYTSNSGSTIKCFVNAENSIEIVTNSKAYSEVPVMFSILYTKK